MKNSIFPILKPRKTHEVINLNLPPKFLKVLQEYSFGNNFFDRKYFFYENDLFPFSSIVFNKKLLNNNYCNSFSQLFDENMLRKELNDYLNNKLHEDIYQGFIKIGYFDKADIILLGVEQSNHDEIWIIAGDLGYERPDILKIANDIFDFFESCYEDIFELNLEVRGLSVSQLYKNWGEDYWRVREENEPKIAIVS
jgi:hypothetical protein